MSALVEQWTNRKWGIARRKIELIQTETGWQVRGHQGADDSRDVVHYFDREEDTWAMVEAMKQAVPAQLATWARMTEVKPPPAPPR